MKEKYDLSEERIENIYAMLRDLTLLLTTDNFDSTNEYYQYEAEDLIDNIADELYDAGIPDPTINGIFKLYGGALMLSDSDPDEEYIDWEVVRLFSPKNSGADIKEEKEIPIERTEEERNNFLENILFNIEDRFDTDENFNIENYQYKINKNYGSVYSLAKKFGITDDDIDYLHSIYSGYKSRLPKGYDVVNHSVRVFTDNNIAGVDRVAYIIAALAISKFEDDHRIMEKILNGFVDNYLAVDNTFVIDDSKKPSEWKCFDNLFTLVDIGPRVLYLDKENNSAVIEKYHMKYLQSDYDPEDILDNFNTETGEIRLENVKKRQKNVTTLFRCYNGIKEDKISSEHDRDSLMLWAIYNCPDLAAKLFCSEYSFDDQDDFLDDEDDGVFMELDK